MKTKANTTFICGLLVALSYLQFGNQLSAANLLTDFGASPPVVKPEGDKSLANQALEFQTDLFTGRFNYHVPIIVPPGRLGSEPTISLAYNSSGANGWCGVGWDLTMGYIQRETKRGVPATGSPYSDSLGFVYSLGGGSGRLINVGGSDYRPEINKSFLKFTYSGGYWVVTDKSGTKYYFGQTSASRIANSRGTFTWALNTILDSNGNKTTVTHNQTVGDGQLYLSQIAYNANDNSPAISAPCTVDFS